jgi:hypothetical protein
MQIDIKNYSENCEPALGAASGCNGQHQPTERQINFGMGISEYGRFSTSYPLWDNTNRALVSWAPSCVATGNCPMVANPLTGVLEAEEGTPVYGVYMLDLNTGNQRPVVTAPAGHSVLDPVPSSHAVERDQRQTPTPRLPKTSSIALTGVGIRM